MGESERRHLQRQESMNFIDYVILGEQGGRGLARTLNLSEEGLLLETTRPLEPGQDLLLTVGLKEELIQFSGHVVHCTPAGEGRFRSGVAFAEVEDRERRVLQRSLETRDDETLH